MYIKKNWVDGELITNEDLNHIEDGLEDVDYRIDSSVEVLDRRISLSTPPDWYYPKNIPAAILGSGGLPDTFSGGTYESFYDWILNPLLRDFPEYVTKTTLGRDSSGSYNVYKYEFIPENYDRTIVITSCVHGKEYTPFFGLNLFLDKVCRDYMNDSNLNFIHEKVKIVYIPIVNPWGFVNTKRHTSSTVDLNRNTSYRWEEYTSSKGQFGGVYYKGTAAFSEVESQYVKQVVESVEFDNLVGYIDYHNIVSIDAEKILYFPRFAENASNKYAELINNFNPELNENRAILGSSSVPSFSNWAGHRFNVNACNPEFNEEVYGPERNEFVMRKFVEWAGNIFLVLAKENRIANSQRVNPFIKMLIWNRDTTLPDTEDSYRMSNKGHRILKSDNYNNFNASRFEMNINGEYTVEIKGNVRVYAEKDCTLHLEPFVYQRYSPEQNYSTMTDEGRFEEIVRLKAGQEIFVPINALLHGFFSNYNDEDSTRADKIHFRIRAKTDVASAAWITGYKVTLNFTPSEFGKCIEINKVIDRDVLEVIYPTRINEDLDD